MFTVAPRTAFGKMGGDNNYIAPSDQLTRGVIGVGGIGNSSSHFVSDQNCRLVALCDVDSEHLSKTLKRAKDTFGETPKSYTDWRDLVHDPDIDIADARPWDIDTPYLYTLSARLLRDDNTVADEATDRFGFRTIAFGPDFGFRLNGRKVLLPQPGSVKNDSGNSLLLVILEELPTLLLQNHSGELAGL